MCLTTSKQPGIRPAHSEGKHMQALNELSSSRCRGCCTVGIVSSLLTQTRYKVDLTCWLSSPLAESMILWPNISVVQRVLCYVYSVGIQGGPRFMVSESTKSNNIWRRNLNSTGQVCHREGKVPKSKRQAVNVLFTDKTGTSHSPTETFCWATLKAMLKVCLGTDQGLQHSKTTKATSNTCPSPVYTKWYSKSTTLSFQIMCDIQLS